MTTQKAIIALDLWLSDKWKDNKVRFTLEQVSKDTNLYKADIHKALQKIQIRLGYSLRIENHMAHYRAVRKGPVDTGRKKGENWKIDPHDKEWEPTKYILQRNLNVKIEVTSSFKD